MIMSIIPRLYHTYLPVRVFYILYYYYCYYYDLEHFNIRSEKKQHWRDNNE